MDLEKLRFAAEYSGIGQVCRICVERNPVVSRLDDSTHLTICGVKEELSNGGENAVDPGLATDLCG